MNIAILVPNFTKSSGDARVAERQASTLAQEGHRVAVFALSADIEPQHVDLFILGMPGHLLWQRFYRLLFPLDVVKTLRWLARLKNFDLIIAHLYPMTWLAYWARRLHGVRYTFWNHGTGASALFSSFYERIYAKMYKLMTRLTTANAERVVSVSQYLSDEFKRETGRDSEVIYNTIDTQRFRPGLDSRRIRQKHHLGGNPVVLSVGRLSPPKGFHLLIEAFNSARQKIPEAKLVIVGRLTYDSYSQRLKRMSDNSVIFAGAVSDEELPYYYASCDVYATCTLWEGYNLPIVEAQACGKPVIAFNLGPHPEVIDGKGVLVEPGDIEVFARACADKLRQVRK
jgi:1,2-diacylglycerol 3-alpha-glucosyltransferase